VSGPARLEPWGVDDLPLLERLLGDPAMMGYLGGAESPTKIRERQARYERRDSRQFKVIDRASGEDVGSVGYWERDWRDLPVYETGWSIIPSSQGRGLAADATARLISRAAAERRRRFMHAVSQLSGRVRARADGRPRRRWTRHVDERLADRSAQPRRVFELEHPGHHRRADLARRNPAEPHSDVARRLRESSDEKGGRHVTAATITVFRHVDRVAL